MESIGIFIQGTTAVGVLVLAVLTFMGRSTNPLREDIGVLREDIGVLREDIGVLREDIKELRTEMHSEMHSMNTRLSRVEGHLRISDDH
jgi:hypothetical protein